MSVEIEAEDVIRLILQFFKENDLQQSLLTLSEETSVNLNTVENRDAFIQDITQGNWDTVLKDIVHLNVAPRKLIDLYEQVVIELCEMRELSAARTLLRQTEPMHIMKQRHPERYLRLEHLLSRSFFEEKEVYVNGMTKEKRRQIIAQALATEITVVPPARLLTLLSQSAIWQQHQGMLPPEAPFDPFKKPIKTEVIEQDAPATHLYSTIKFPGKNTNAECAIFSPNGQFLVTGSVDGFIEVWNHVTGKLRKDLAYQAEENLMAMDESVICLGFSRDSELLVSGSTDGKIAIWKVQSGNCQRKISPAHSQGVTSVCFSKDGSKVLSGSYDQTVKIHDVRSGKLLKEFKGHSSFVNTTLFSPDNTTVISGSSDGNIKIWSMTDAACLYTIHPDKAHPKLAVQGILSVPGNADQMVVCLKGRNIHLMTMHGNNIKTFSQKTSGAENIAVSVSPRGKFIYAISEDSTLTCFDAETASVVHRTKIGDNELIGIVSHPFANILAVYDDSGHVYLYNTKEK